MPMNKLGELIRDIRTARGMSQETLAKLVDYDRSNFLNIEAGKKPAPEDLLERIGIELDIPPERLVALKILDSQNDEVKRWLRIELDALGSHNP